MTAEGLDVFRDAERIMDLLEARPEHGSDVEACQTCRRGVHPLTPENLGEGRRCVPCKREYQHARRHGLGWDGPIIGRVAMAAPRRPMTRAQLRRDRAAVGACLDCGWTPDVGPHRCVRA